MARPRKTLEELRRHGTYRRDRHGPGEPIDLPAPPKPGDLSPAASAMWDQLVPDLVRLGAGSLDVLIIRAVCDLWAKYLCASKDADKRPDDPKARAATLDYFGALERATSKLGLNLIDRSRVRVKPAEEASGMRNFAREREHEKQKKPRQKN